MDALAAAEHFVQRHPAAPDSVVLHELVRALREDVPFDVQRLYPLTLSNFELALEVLQAWRIQRYYLGSAVTVAAVTTGH